MRNRIKFAGVLGAAIAMMLLLSGCVQMIIGVNISGDGSADVSVKAGIANNVYEMLADDETQNPMAETQKEAEDNGYTVEQYTEGEYRGLIMTKHIDDFEASSDTDTYTEGLSLKKEKCGFKQIIKLSGKLVNADSLKQNMNDSDIDISQFDMKLVVSVPYPITNSNATSISGDKKTATFDLVTLDKIELECAGDIVLFGCIPMPAAAAVVAVLAAAAIVLIVIGIIKKKKGLPERNGRNEN